MRHRYIAERAAKARSTRTCWTATEEQQLFDYDLPDDVLAVRLGRSVSAIRKHRYVLLKGMGVPDQVTTVQMQAYRTARERRKELRNEPREYAHITWTSEHQQMLFRQDLTDRQISQATGHSIASIQKMRWELMKGIHEADAALLPQMQAYTPKQHQPHYRPAP